jgi:diguanylate cyclase (GGDEF)-like protein
MRRWAASWQGLAAVLALAALGLALLAHDVQRQHRDRTFAQLAHKAALISELAVEAQVPSGEYGALAYPDRLAITRSVQHLKHGDRVIGLMVWAEDGALLFSDTPAAEPLDSAELAALPAALDGQPQVLLGHQAHGPRPAISVLVEVHDGTAGAHRVATEVLLPQDASLAALDGSTRRLYALMAGLFALITVVLFALRRRVQRREHDATHDPLTGLGNRARLHAAGTAAVRAAGARPESGTVALLLLDLDGFKTVNDTLGHALGDELLVQVGQTLRESVRPQDLVIRLGGDEFGVLLTGLPDNDAAVRIAHGLHDALARPYVVQDVSLEVGGSIGVAPVTDRGDDLALLLRRADVAMYQAKRAGGGVSVYDETADPHDEAHLSLLAQLRGAIDGGQLRLHFQPRVNLREGNTVGLEALVRWEHPTRGLLYPDAFIPLAESTALMRPLTSWVLAEATAHVAAWRAAGWPVSVAVNIPPRALLEGDLCREVLQVLSDNDLPGEALELEITETAVMVDPIRAAQTLRELRAVGVGVAIDDFGAGYTSLSFLKTLPVRSLKIDRGFVTDLIGSSQDEAVARSVVALGHDLGLTVVAEGVETAEVQQRLRELGCDEVQGYLLSRPMVADLVEPWLLGAAAAQREAALDGLPQPRA